MISSVRPKGVMSSWVKSIQIQVTEHTNVSRVELIHANEDCDGCGPEGPRGQWAEDRELAFMHVIHQDWIKLAIWKLVRAENTRPKARVKAQHTPIWLCITNDTPRIPSNIGNWLGLTANAAIVIGTNPAERRRSNAQWYDPCDFDGGGKVVGSFTVPLYTAEIQNLIRIMNDKTW